jgi:hypothetical protein
LLAVSLGLLVGFHLLLTYTGALGNTLNNWLGTQYNLIFFMTLLLVGGAIGSYLNNGVITSVVLVAAPLIGIFLSGNIGFVRDPTLFEYAHADES